MEGYKDFSTFGDGIVENKESSAENEKITRLKTLVSYLPSTEIVFDYLNEIKIILGQKPMNYASITMDPLLVDICLDLLSEKKNSLCRLGYSILLMLTKESPEICNYTMTKKNMVEHFIEANRYQHLALSLLAKIIKANKTIIVDVIQYDVISAVLSILDNSFSDSFFDSAIEMIINIFETDESFPTESSINLNYYCDRCIDLCSYLFAISDLSLREHSQIRTVRVLILEKLFLKGLAKQELFEWLIIRKIMDDFGKIDYFHLYINMFIALADNYPYFFASLIEESPFLSILSRISLMSRTNWPIILPLIIKTSLVSPESSQLVYEYGLFDCFAGDTYQISLPPLENNLEYFPPISRHIFENSSNDNKILILHLFCALIIMIPHIMINHKYYSSLCNQCIELLQYSNDTFNSIFLDSIISIFEHGYIFDGDQYALIETISDLFLVNDKYAIKAQFVLDKIME